MSHISMTSKIKALSAVAHHLGTDLTTQRCSGQRSTWLCVSGGDHLIQTHDARVFRVDLVCGTVREV